METKQYTIADLAEYWDDLTPKQKQALVHKAKWFIGYNEYNKMMDEREKQTTNIPDSAKDT